MPCFVNHGSALLHQKQRRTRIRARPLASLASLPDKEELQKAPGTRRGLYIEGPSLPTRSAPSVIGLAVGLYLDSVSAGRKIPSVAFQAAGGPPIGEPHIRPVEVHVYVVLGQIVTLPVQHGSLDGGAGAIDVSGGTRRGYEDSAPRNTAPAAPFAAGSRPPSPTPAHAYFLPCWSKVCYSSITLLRTASRPPR